MTTTTAPPPTGDLRLRRPDFDRAASRAGLSEQDRQQLWAALAESAAPARVGTQALAWYGGASTTLVAMGLFLGTSWAAVGSGVGLALVLTYVAALLLVCEVLRTRGHRTPAGLLAATVVALVPLAVFAAQETYGLWTERSYGAYDSFLAQVSGQWVVMELLTLAASVAVWRRHRTPFLLLPSAVVGWFLTMDLADAVTAGAGDTGGAGALVSAAVTAVLLTVAVLLDRRELRGEAFWLHLSGLASLLYVLSNSGLSTPVTMTLVGVAGAACLAAGVLLARRVHLVFGTGFVFAALAYLAYDVFGGSPVFALVLGAVGVAAVLGGVRLDRGTGARQPLRPAA